VVNTLTEFPTIDQVQLRFDGKTKSKLPNGTSVAEPLGTMPLNTEPLPVNASEDMQYALTLYYPNRQASLNIPVTRCVAREPDFDLAMRELLNGPQDAALLNCFPEGTKVLSTSLENDIATVNLSREFEQLANNPDLEQAAIQTMQLTARHFGAVAQLQVQVEGEAYQGAEAQTMAMPLYVNEYR